METVIPLAGLQSIYSVADVDRAREDSSARRNEGLKGWYDRMRELGGSRYIVKPSTHKAVDDLYDASPNFAEVIDDLRKFLALAVSGNEAVQFTPMLLLGEPGLGKTYFAKRLAQALGTGFEFVSMSSLTAGWVLTGASSQWHNARPGKVAQTLIEGDYANPVVVLDEVDKSGGDARYDPMGALYTLLERDTASALQGRVHRRRHGRLAHPVGGHRERRDGDPRADPEPDERLRDRAPGCRGLAPHRAGGLPRDPRRSTTGRSRPSPTRPCVEQLATIPPRDMRKLLLDAFGTARLAGARSPRPRGHRHDASCAGAAPAWVSDARVLSYPHVSRRPIGRRPPPAYREVGGTRLARPPPACGRPCVPTSSPWQPVFRLVSRSPAPFRKAICPRGRSSSRVPQCSCCRSRSSRSRSSSRSATRATSGW